MGGFFDKVGDFLGTAAKAAAPILGASNPWLGVGATLLGGALSKGKSSGATTSTDPAAIAAGYPTQTPQQSELTGFAMPYLKGWMTNPFQITSQPIQPTKVAVGGNKLGYTPGSTSPTGQSQVSRPAPGTGSTAIGPLGTTGQQALPGGTTARNFTITPGMVNLPEVPTIAPTFGTLGQHAGVTQEGRQIRNLALDAILNPLQEGYDATYLNNLAEGQTKPLTEAYKEAIAASDADFNRRGLRASTMPVGKAFGSQPNSITRNFLNAVGDVERDVNLRGLEAARDDRARNAQMRLQNEQFLNNLLQQDEANRQWWSGFGQNQQEFDVNNAIKNWQLQTGLGQYLVGREDAANQANQTLDLSLQKDNIGLQQDALNNINAFITGQQPTASRASSNYANAVQMAQANQAKADQNQQDVVNWLTDIFSKTQNRNQGTTTVSPAYAGGQQLANSAWNAATNFWNNPSSVTPFLQSYVPWNLG